MHIPPNKALPLSFSTYLKSLLTASLKNDNLALQTLLNLPVLGHKIPLTCHELSSCDLAKYLIQTFTQEFSNEEFLELFDQVNRSPYIATLGESKLLDLYQLLFNCPQMSLFTKTTFLCLNEPPVQANILPHILTKTLTHRSFKDASLSEVLSIIKEFKPQSDLLNSHFFSALFKHPAIQHLNRDILIHHFQQIPTFSKIPFLTQMMQHPSFRKLSLEDLLHFIEEFRSYPKNEFLTTLFYEAIFKHNSITSCSDKRTLKMFYPKKPTSDEMIPILHQMLKLPLFKESSIPQIKNYMRLFKKLYKQHPCSTQLALKFYTTLFQLTNISQLSEKDLPSFLQKVPKNLLIPFFPKLLKYSQRDLLSKETLMIFLEYAGQKPSLTPESRSTNLTFFKGIFDHPAIKNMSSQEITEQIIVPAKGYQLIDLILSALESKNTKLFPPNELSVLNKLFLDEIEILEGPKSPSRMDFYTLVCSNFQEKGQLTEREARKETRKLVFSYKNPE